MFNLNLNLLTFILLISFVISPNESDYKKPIGSSVNYYTNKLFTYFGTSDLKVNKETNPQAESIFVQNSVLKAELVSLASGNGFLPSLKHSTITPELHLFFIYASEYLDSNLQSHKFDYFIYEMIVVTRDLRINNWIELNKIKDKFFIIYNFDKIKFQNFRGKIIQGLDLIVDLLSNFNHIKTFVDIFDKLEVLELICKKRFQEKGKSFSEVTYFYEVKKTVIKDYKSAHFSQKVYSTIAMINRIGRMHLYLQIKILENEFYFAILTAIYNLKELLNNTHNPMIVDHGFNLVKLILGFLDSGHANKSILFGDFYEFKEEELLGIQNIIKNKGDLFQNACKNANEKLYCEIYDVKLDDLSHSLQRTFVTYKHNWVRYIGVRPIEATLNHELQQTFLNELWIDLQDINSHFYARAPAALPIVLKTVNSRLFKILDAEFQADEIIKKLIRFLEISKTVIKGAKLVHAANNPSINMAVDYPVLSCFDFEVELKSQRDSNFLKAFKISKDQNEVDKFELFKDSLRSLSEFLNESVYMSNEVCVEILDDQKFNPLTYEIQKIEDKVRSIKFNQQGPVLNLENEINDINAKQGLHFPQNEPKLIRIDQVQEKLSNHLNTNLNVKENEIEPEKKVKKIRKVVLIEFFECKSCKKTEFLNNLKIQFNKNRFLVKLDY